MKKAKPTSPGRRGTATVTYRGVLTASKPKKALTKGFKRSVGRNNQGRITTRHKGSGHKRLFREIDFKYSKKDVPAKIETVEYDPNRSAFICLAVYADGERRYHLAPKGVQVGDKIVVAENAPIKPGNRTRLKNVPVGTFVHAVEIQKGTGAKFGRSAGNAIEVIAHNEGYMHLKMPSSEVRRVPDTAWASIGEVSNDEHKLRNLGKAGRSRWLGIRPTVRGSAMNPVDHPYGGGEGRQGRGTRRSKSKWGKETGQGHKTRRPKKYSNTFIVTRRKVGKRK
jgi:large subunit ribosomal protein L2